MSRTESIETEELPEVEGVKDPEAYDFWPDIGNRVPADALYEDMEGIHVDVENENIIATGEEPVKCIVNWENGSRLYESVRTEDGSTTRVYYLDTGDQTLRYADNSYESTPVQIDGTLSEIDPETVFEGVKELYDRLENEQFFDLPEFSEPEPETVGERFYDRKDVGKAGAVMAGCTAGIGALLENPEANSHLVDLAGHLGAGVAATLATEMGFRLSGLEDRYGEDLKYGAMASVGVLAAAGIEVSQGVGIISGSLNQGFGQTLLGTSAVMFEDVLEDYRQR